MSGKPQSQWQPIETAPKVDGAHILVFGNSPESIECIFVAAWDDFFEGFREVYGGEFVDATHWMSCPRSPEAAP